MSEFSAPGIYYDVPARDYHALPAASNSRVGVLADRTPAHLKEQIDNPPASTPALVLGDAIHLAVLQPDLLKERYVFPDQCEAITGKKERCSKQGTALIDGQWFCSTASHAPTQGEKDRRAVLSYADYQRVQAIRDGVYRHPKAAALLRSSGHNEVSFLWEDEEFGIPCKMRVDGVRNGGAVLVDVKSTEDAGKVGFQKSIADYGYHRQAAWYTDGARRFGLSADHFLFIPCEKSPPYATALYRIDEEAIHIGREELRPLLKLYAECEKAGVWPGHSEQIEDISLPEWKLRSAAVASTFIL